MEGARCQTCKHRDEEAGQLHCHRFPPQVVMVPQVNKITREVAMSPAAAFPVVAAQAWCGEYTAGSAVLNA